MKHFILAAITTAVCATDYVDQREPQDVHEHDLGVVDWYVKGVRGMYGGLYRGLYHDKKKIDDRCLSSGVKDEVHSVMEFLAYGEWVDVFILADSVTSLYFDNKNYCMGDSAAHDIGKHCKPTEDGRPCSFVQMIKNLTGKNLIESMGASSVLAETYHSLDL
jgi:hypothetical protein